MRSPAICSTEFVLSLVYTRYKSPSCLLCASSYTPDSPLEVPPRHSGFIQHHRRWFAHPTQCSQLPCGATQGIYHNYTKTQNFTHFITPTPRIPILCDFWPEPLKFERDFCIGYPHFRWTPLPEAIPSRRNDPDFCPKQTIFPRYGTHISVFTIVTTNLSEHSPYYLLTLSPPQAAIYSPIIYQIPIVYNPDTTPNIPHPDNQAAHIARQHRSKTTKTNNQSTPEHSYYQATL